MFTKLLFRNNGIQIDRTTAKMVWLPIIDFERVNDFKSKKFYGGISGSQLPFWLLKKGVHNMVYFEQLQLTLSCAFNFVTFPFDSHECYMKYGDYIYGTEKLTLTPSIIMYGNYRTSVGEGHIILNDSTLPFEFELQYLPSFEKKRLNQSYSITGMNIKMRRNSLGHLLCAYYYPTAAFAFLSMISFLINPDVVSVIAQCSNRLGREGQNFPAGLD